MGNSDADEKAQDFKTATPSGTNRSESSTSNLSTSRPYTPSPSTSIASNPFSQLASKQSPADPPKISITSSREGSRSLKRDRPSSANDKSASTQLPSEEWESKILSSIFRVTLDSDHRQDSQSHRLRFLKDTRADIEASGDEIRLSTGILDQALLEAASNLGKHDMALDYLLPCWKRISAEYKRLRRAGDKDEKFTIVEEARRLCFSYCVFAITMPDMFG